MITISDEITTDGEGRKGRRKEGRKGREEGREEGMEVLDRGKGRERCQKEAFKINT